MKYRIQRWGNNGYKVQRFRKFKILSIDLSRWTDYKTGFMDAIWTQEFSTVASAKKKINELKEIEENRRIGWKTVCDI